MKTNLTKAFFFLFSVALMFTSCEDEDSGSGNYIIGVSNASDNTIQMQVLLDGESKGIFFVKAGQQGNYGSLCNDLVYAATLDNVLVLNYVSSGSHKLVLKNYDTGFVYTNKEFDMEGDCIAQQFNLD